MDKEALKQEITKLKIKLKDLKTREEGLFKIALYSIVGIWIIPMIHIVFSSEEKRLNRLIRELELELNQ